MRNAHLFEALPPVTIVSNTASAISSRRPYLRTIDSTTNVITDATGSVARVRIKTVDAAGTALQTSVHISVGPDLNSITLNNSTTNLGIAPPGGGTPYSSDYYAHTDGVVDVSFTFATAGSKVFVISYGDQRVSQAFTIT